MDEFTGENEDINQVKQKRAARDESIPLEMDYSFVPKNPYSFTVNTEGLGRSKIIPEESPEYQPSFFSAGVEEGKELNVGYNIGSAIYKQLSSPNPYDDIPMTGWDPKNDPSKYIDIDPKYYNYAFEATGPKDLDYRIQRIHDEQRHDEALKNGSMTARIMGGLLGMTVLDPVSYIPIISMAKYGKMSAAVFKNAARVFPGVAAYSVLQSGSEYANKINTTVSEAVTNAAINTVFGTALFGVAGAAGLTMEKMNLMSLKSYAKEFIDGVDFRIKLDPKGEITGLQAVDKTGNLSAAKVEAAQSMADSEFAKTGLFKIPYVGKGLYHMMTMPVLGSPLPQLLNSKYKTLAAFADRAIDHTILTSGLVKGETAPVKFETLMNQEHASLRMLGAQVDALYLERNGYNIENRAAAQLTRAGLSAKNRTLEVLKRDLEKNDYVKKESFYDEVENVLINEVASEHPSVNSAASLIRPKLDNTYAAWRKAYNLPEDWLPPRTAAGYLMRVYDTKYLNGNEEKWVGVVSDWLTEADNTIMNRMKPIKDIESQISLSQQHHEELIRGVNKTDSQVKSSVEQISALKIRKKVLEENLQNELRTNENLQLHVEDWNHLSAKEADELNSITKRRDIAAREIEAQNKYIADMKSKMSKRQSSAMKAKTVETAKKQLRRRDTGELALTKEEEKLRTLELEHADEVEKIQELIEKGVVNPRFYTKEPNGQRYILRDPSERLRFRKTYESDFHRRNHAKAYFDTIMNQTSQDTINQVMGRISGNVSENHLKSRTLLLPDNILKDNNFLTKDLMAKTSNYVSYLSRRTNLKSVFNDVTVEGGIEPLIANMNVEHEAFRKPLIDKKEKLDAKLLKTEDSKQKLALKKEIAKVDKDLNKERIVFDDAKKKFNHVYEKMMGIKKMDRGARAAQSLIMSMTAMSSLGFVPLTMINDLGAQGLQHGIWPLVRDGVYPIAQSLMGILKTKDSESIRKTAPSINLALQDVLNGTADKNWAMGTEPYLNMGKIVSGAENLAHFASNFNMTNYLDNHLQRIAGAVSQGEFMRILHAFKDGSITKNESLYLRKYGIDPEKWAERMVASFESDGGGKTAVGGYQSLFWQWQDLEASNEFSRAVFRAIQNTTIKRGMADSPFWADNFIGSLIHGFNGWTYASLNRYVIPSMQQPNAQVLAGVSLMLGTGYFVSPLRRLARGEEAFPESQTPEQRFYETIADSGYFSYFTNFLSDANILTGDRLLEDLKNDRYVDRTRAGLLGPSWGKMNQMADIIGAASYNEMNQADLKKMARMLPMFNASWTWWMSKDVIEGLNIPKTRAEAKRQKEFSE